MTYYEIQKIPVGFLTEPESKALQAALLRRFFLDLAAKAMKSQTPLEELKFLFQSRYEPIFDALSKDAAVPLCTDEE